MGHAAVRAECQSWQGQADVGVGCGQEHVDDARGIGASEVIRKAGHRQCGGL